ncbi:unnamed protein product, partial [marine sediment metagenome]
NNIGNMKRFIENLNGKKISRREIENAVSLINRKRKLLKKYSRIFTKLPELISISSYFKVNSVKISESTATVDFSKEIITNFQEIPHSSTTEVLAIFSIVNTLTEFEEIKKVKITIEGKDSGQVDGLYIEDFWGHVGIYEEFTRNEDIIKSS